MLLNIFETKLYAKLLQLDFYTLNSTSLRKYPLRSCRPFIYCGMLEGLKILICIWELSQWFRLWVTLEYKIAKNQQKCGLSARKPDVLPSNVDFSCTAHRTEWEFTDCTENSRSPVHTATLALAFQENSTLEASFKHFAFRLSKTLLCFGILFT